MKKTYELLLLIVVEGGVFGTCKLLRSVEDANRLPAGMVGVVLPDDGPETVSFIQFIRIS